MGIIDGMKISEISGLQNPDPARRAYAALQIGAALHTRRRAPIRAGRLPAFLREGPSLGIAGEQLKALHGVRAVRPLIPTRGLIWMGTLATPHGEVPDVVLSPPAMKAERRRAVRLAPNEPVERAALRALAVSLLDSDPIPRVCAAYAYWQATGARHVAVPILSRSLKAADEDEFLLAAHALARIDPALVSRHVHRPGRPGRGRPRRPRGPGADGPIAPSMTVLIHGTFAHDQKWYRPGGDFHRYIKGSVFPDVYSDPADYFSWSGGYSDDERQKAARKLVRWCADHPATVLRLMGHSHGANVANIASKSLPTCTLIHLSPPVHDEYLPDMTTIGSGKFFNIHSQIDLVVFIDGGAQDYRGTPVEAHEKRKRCARFGHAKSHDPGRWKEIEASDFVRQVCT